MARFGWPDDYFTTYPGKVRALTQGEVEHAAQLAVQPGRLIWVVIGDRSKVAFGLGELGWGEIHFLDPDGRPVK
jgi:zinc protease